MKLLPYQKLTSIGQSSKSLRHTSSVWSTFLLAVTMMLLLQCKSGDTIEQSMLYGKWDIFKAERNGKETPYLRNGYMIINRDGTMTVNITGSDENGKFVLDDQIVRMNETEEFVIESFTADSMTMQYHASPQSEFMFYMARHENQIQ